MLEGNHRTADYGTVASVVFTLPPADELINLFALAINSGIDSDALKRMPFAYPTAASYLDSMLAE